MLLEVLQHIDGKNSYFEQDENDDDLSQAWLISLIIQIGSEKYIGWIFAC